MRPNGEISRFSVNGVEARRLDLSGRSPILQTGSPLPERDRLVVVPAAGSGADLYLIFIAPERDFGELEPTFQKMLASLRLQ